MLCVLQVLKDTDVHPMKLLAINAQLAAVFFFPIWFLRDATSMWTDFTASVRTTIVPGLFVVAGSNSSIA